MTLNFEVEGDASEGTELIFSAYYCRYVLYLLVLLYFLVHTIVLMFLNF